MTITHTNIPATLKHIWPEIFPKFEGTVSNHDWGILKEYVVLFKDDELDDAVQYLRLWVKFKCRDIDKDYFEDVFVYKPKWESAGLTQNPTCAVKVMWVRKPIETV